MASMWVLPIIVSILIFTLVLSQNTEAQFQVEGELPIDPILALQEENRLLKEKIIELEKIIDDLNSMIMEQPEQAIVREVVPTTPSKIPSAEKSIAEMFSGGQSEPIGLPCLDCITADFIAPGAVGANQIASGAVIEGKIAPNAVRASEIAVRAVGASELNMSIKSFTAVNAGGYYTIETKMVPNNGKNFCGLVKVKMENLDNSVQIDAVADIVTGSLLAGLGAPLFVGESQALLGTHELITSNIGKEIAECDIDVGGKTHWVLQATLGAPNKDANVSCQAICISYG